MLTPFALNVAHHPRCLCGVPLAHCLQSFAPQGDRNLNQEVREPREKRSQRLPFVSPAFERSNSLDRSGLQSFSFCDRLAEGVERKGGNRPWHEEQR